MNRPMLLLMVAAASGCGIEEPLAPETNMYLGIIQYTGHPQADPVHWQAPDSAPVGQEIAVSVTTWGIGCPQVGVTQVTVEGSTVVIEPFDDYGEVRCASATLISLEHIARFSIPITGEATIQVIGLRAPKRKVIRVERTLLVY